MTSPPRPPSPPDGPPFAVSLVRSQRMTPSPPRPACARMVISSTNAITAHPITKVKNRRRGFLNDLPSLPKKQFGFLEFERLRFGSLFDGDGVVASVRLAFHDGRCRSIRRFAFGRGRKRAARPLFFRADARIVGRRDARNRFPHGGVDARFHLAEARESFPAVFDQGIALAVGAQRYRAAQVFHALELLEPEGVCYLQHEPAHERDERRRPYLGFLRLICGERGFVCAHHAADEIFHFFVRSRKRATAASVHRKTLGI